MIKIALCAIIVCFSALAGWSRASVYAERVRALGELTTNLKYLESEMGYRMEPLPVLLQRIGENRVSAGGIFFSEAARLLLSQEAESLWDAWVMALQEAYSVDVLSPSDRKIVEELGYELGQTDMENQRRLFSHCYSGLALAAESAREEARIKGRMYKGLGVSAGILTAVLFL